MKDIFYLKCVKKDFFLNEVNGLTNHSSTNYASSLFCMFLGYISQRLHSESISEYNHYLSFLSCPAVPYKIITLVVRISLRGTTMSAKKVLLYIRKIVTF